MTGRDSELLDAVRTVVEGVTARWDRRYYLECAEKNVPPDELYRAMAEQGLFALGVPEQHGGSGGGVTAVAAVMEEMSRAGVPPMLFSLTAFCRSAILRFGSAEQIERYVRPTLDASTTFAFAFTEPESGTNSFAMRSFARPSGDGGYLLSGEKVFISGADAASAILVAARTTPYDEVTRKSDGLSLFVIDAHAPGMSASTMNIDWRAPERQFTVRLDDVAIRPGSVIGAPGEGAKAIFEALNSERVVIAAWTLGLGYRALERAVNYARTRAPWGRPIGSYQAVAHPLARARVLLDAARTMTYEAAATVDAQEPSGAQANAAKLLASEAADLALDAAIQTYGGSAFDEESDLVALWPMIRILRIAPLNNEMVLNYMAEHVLGLPRSY
jgi:alkylation response protein AidB-like acyl-CoA dehydrogenase